MNDRKKISRDMHGTFQSRFGIQVNRDPPDIPIRTNSKEQRNMKNSLFYFPVFLIIGLIGTSCRKNDDIILWARPPSSLCKPRSWE